MRRGAGINKKHMNAYYNPKELHRTMDEKRMVQQEVVNVHNTWCL